MGVKWAPLYHQHHIRIFICTHGQIATPVNGAVSCITNSTTNSFSFWDPYSDGSFITQRVCRVGNSMSLSIFPGQNFHFSGANTVDGIQSMRLMFLIACFYLIIPVAPWYSPFISQPVRLGHRIFRREYLVHLLAVLQKRPGWHFAPMRRNS